MGLAFVFLLRCENVMNVLSLTSVASASDEDNESDSLMDSYF